MSVGFAARYSFQGPRSILVWIRPFTIPTSFSMQTSSILALYELESKIKATNDLTLIDDFRKLTTSDHFYYMCTKWFNDGDIHAYFSPYENPYDAFVAFMNAWHDLKFRLADKGIDA